MWFLNLWLFYLLIKKINSEGDLIRNFRILNGYKHLNISVYANLILTNKVES